MKIVIKMLKGTAFVVRGNLRIKVFGALQEELNPTRLAKLFDRDSSTISEVLADLSKEGLVKNITERNKRSTFYSHTKVGKAVFKDIQKLGLSLWRKGDKE